MNTNNSIIDESVFRIIQSYLNDEVLDLFSDIDNNNTDFYNINITVYQDLDNYINNDRELEEVLNLTFEDDLENHSLTEKSYNLVINTRRYKKIKKKYSEEKSCSICLSEYEDEDKIVINLKCKHIFHKECLKSWGKMSNKCPICRTEMAVKD